MTSAGLPGAWRAALVEQVADEPGEQPAFARHRRGLAREIRPSTRGLPGGKRMEVDALPVRRPLQGVEAARQQDLLDQLVQLLHVALDAGAQRRVAVLRQQLDRHADARERGAQLVGGGGERLALGLDQRLDALGRPVEAARERRDLVPALDLDPGGEIARAQRLHPGLQPLQPPREPARQRPRADGDGQRQQGEGDKEADRLRVRLVPLRPHQDEAAVAQRQGIGAALVCAPALGPLFGRFERRAQAAEQRAVRPEQGDAGIERAAQAGKRRFDLVPWRARRRQRFLQQGADAPAEFVVGCVVGEPPADGGEHAEQHDDAEQRQVDLEEEAPPHVSSSSSWRRVKT